VVSKHRSDVLILMPGLNDILHILFEEFTRNTADRHLRAAQEKQRCRFGADKACNDTHLNDYDAESVFQSPFLWERIPVCRFTTNKSRCGSRKYRNVWRTLASVYSDYLFSKPLHQKLRIQAALSYLLHILIRTNYRVPQPCSI
jgi:hypothetical protein